LQEAGSTNFAEERSDHASLNPHLGQFAWQKTSTAPSMATTFVTFPEWKTYKAIMNNGQTQNPKSHVIYSNMDASYWIKPST
jgi:hypothetical protein